MVKDLHSFLREMEKTYPEELLRVTKVVDPLNFEVSALLQKLEDMGRFPVVLFERPKNLKGEVAEFKLLINVFASRQRCALALGLAYGDWKLPLSLEYARRERGKVEPIIINKDNAPVKEVVKRGGDVDLSELPIVRFHEMDAGPYIDMTPIMKYPEGEAYEVSFLRTMYKGPRKLGIYMSPRHNWHIYKENAERGIETPVVIVIGHHPAFYLGSLALTEFGNNDYETIGSFLGEPLRLTESETWGDKFLVPADAEIVIEGVIPPDELEAEAPFGEFTGYYGPQRLSPVVKVTAVTYRRGAIYQSVFVGHMDNWILGGVPKEGSLYNLIKRDVPTVKAVHFPPSGCCRFNCYISIDKKFEGAPKVAALTAIAHCDSLKNVIVVDSDVDVFSEREVLWALATRTQASRSVEIIRDVKGCPLDPSQTHEAKGDKLIIDATKPLDYPFAERLKVPKHVLDKVRIEEYISASPPEGRVD